MPLGTLGRHQLQSVDLHELPLERRGDIIGHGLGTRARIIGLDLDNRVVNRRQIVYRQTKVTENAEQNRRQSQDRRHDRSANEWFREIHDLSPGFAGVGSLSAVLGCVMFTFPPGVTPS